MYLYALDHKEATAATLLADAPIAYSWGPGRPPYQPHDADEKFAARSRCGTRWLTLERARGGDAESHRNQVVPRHASRLLGVTTLEDPSQYGLSLALGSGGVPLLDLTYAYAGLANGGVEKSASRSRKTS